MSSNRQTYLHGPKLREWVLQCRFRMRHRSERDGVRPERRHLRLLRLSENVHGRGMQS
jgi:hypothetical protein